MVRKAAEGLDADDVRDAAPDELHHLACEEPALTGLVADGDELLCIVHNRVDRLRGLEVLRLRIGLVDRL